MASFARFLIPSLALIVFAGIVVGQESKPETYAERLPGKGATVTFEMVRIPGGTFAMKVGEEERSVTVKPIWMGKTEVTWDQYDVFRFGWDLPVETGEETLARLIVARTRPSKPHGRNPDDDFGHDGYPAIRMHFNAAVMFARWLSESTGRKYRLATEAEWEWACRGGGDGERPSEEQLDEAGWFSKNSTPDGAEGSQTAPVGKKKPNGYGLHDMLGNAQEWTTVVDEGADTDEVRRYVTKGGSFKSTAAGLHSRFRQFQTPSWQFGDEQDPKSRWWLSNANFVGFRVVRED